VTSTAVYVYGVARAEDAARLPSGDGAIDAAFPLELVDHDGLLALASELEVEPFESGIRSAEQGDLARLEPMARAHEAVLARALGARALLPFRFGTVVASRDDVRTLLRDRAPEFRSQLDALEGAREWGVKALLDREQLASALAADEPALAELRSEAAAGTGTAFFARKRLEQEVEARLRDAAAEIAESVHDRLSLAARDAALNPPQPRELSGYDDEMILNGAYLVDREREPELREAVDELRGEVAERGVRLDLTGPWPAFNFVRAAERTAS
jgi:Gas vesicle synthesis protein GvpL/GvpF